MKARRIKKSGEVVLEFTPDEKPLMAAAGSFPFKIERIVVPLDFSNCSRKALQYAVPFARLHNATITLVYVVPTQYAIGEYGGIDYSTIQHEACQQAEKQLMDFVRDELPRGVKTEAIIRLGSASEEVIDVARRLPADVIIMSTHGHSGLKHVFLGSVTEQVVRHAPCPVLVVREQEHEFIRTGN